MSHSWKGLLGALLRREELTAAETAWAMHEIMSGSATSAQIAGFALLLRAKGETAREVAGLVDTMLAVAAPYPHDEQQRARSLDVVGTGGDQAHTVNISTMAAIVAAAAGVRVIKHGNRAASSSCGTADVLEHLGIPLDLTPEKVAAVADAAGITFCFARTFHPGVRHAAAARSELGVPTAFNLLGPLTNPARPRAGAIGCAALASAPVMAQVYADRGDTVLVVRGEDGLDEITTAAPTRIWLARAGTVTETLLDVADLGVVRAEPGALRGSDVAYNAEVLQRTLAGEHGAVRDAVLVNAAAALVAHGWASGAETAELMPALRLQLKRATAAIDSGAATATLDRWIKTARSSGG